MGSNVLVGAGALMIFTSFLISSNRVMIDNTQVAEQNEYYISALSLAQSIIDEARTKEFDQMTVSGVVSSPDSLSFLGPDGSVEMVPNPDVLTSTSPYNTANPGYLSMIKFNDIDDYNGYRRVVNTPRTEGFNVRVSVVYADPTNPDVTISPQKTFCKRLTVTVTSPFMPESVALSHAFIY